MKKQSIYRSCKLIAISSIISDQYSIYFTFISPLDSLDCWVSSVHYFRPPSLTSDSKPQNYKSEFYFLCGFAIFNSQLSKIRQLALYPLVGSRLFFFLILAFFSLVVVIYISSTWLPTMLPPRHSSDFSAGLHHLCMISLIYLVLLFFCWTDRDGFNLISSTWFVFE